MRSLFAMSLLLFIAACDENREWEALGTLERDRVVLKSTANEIITRLPVSEGEWVSAGTLIVQLDDRRQQAKVAKAKAALAQAEAHWELLRNGARIEDIDAAKAAVEGAQAELVVAEKNFIRAAELLEKQLGSQSNLDQARAARDSANANLKSAQTHLLALTNGTRKEELDQAEASVAAAHAEWDIESLQLDELSIEATRDGRLDALPWNEGERVAPGTTVAVLLADVAPFARVYIPEPSRAQLHIATPMQVKVDGVAKTFKGAVRWISDEPAFTPYYALNERDRARLMYLAEISLQDAEDLPSGLPVTASRVLP